MQKRSKNKYTRNKYKNAKRELCVTNKWCAHSKVHLSFRDKLQPLIPFYDPICWQTDKQNDNDFGAPACSFEMEQFNLQMSEIWEHLEKCPKLAKYF